ncbi:MAG: 50S ribosomal protein L3 [Candidatus Uhrbacteria bacterium]|nr:50S ribosomal protein L3 [Patescibacteria group bacterium]
MKFILGKKIEMSQIFKEDGTVIPVTLIQTGSCQVTGLRTVEKDGYSAVQIGFGSDKNVNKPQVEEAKKLKLQPVTTKREFRVGQTELKIGDKIEATDFSEGDKVDVVGVSKGKGFQGVVKRHGFKGSPASHGHKDQLRMPGSIGSQAPQRVLKGKRMGGRMGGDQVTVKNLEIAAVDPKKQIIAIKGAVPGARNTLLLIRERAGNNIWGN